MQNIKSGIAIATAAAALFALGAAPLSAVAAEDGGVKCVGGNSCKGSSECKTAKNECKGQNGCKGMGWTKTKTAEECTKAGGKVAKS